MEDFIFDFEQELMDQYEQTYVEDSMIYDDYCLDLDVESYES